MNRALLIALVGCSAPQTSRPADHYELLDLSGGWRWIHRTSETETTRVEDEQWELKADGAGRLVGRYLRALEVRSTDTQVFPCSQRRWYRQRAIYDVMVEAVGDGFTVWETGYEAEPSPCDHGFRRVASYEVVPRGMRLELRWDGGSQTLWHVNATATELPRLATAAGAPAGSWRWQTRYYDDERNVRDEAEWWQFTPRGNALVDATYRRRVTVSSLDGAPIACAGASSWSFDDAYVLDGKREEEHWHFVERGFDAGEHPCLRDTPRRSLDEATAEQLGDSLVLEWRGKRRQVLYRPD